MVATRSSLPGTVVFTIGMQLTSQFTQMTTLTGAFDIAAGDFNADGIADVASSWVSGLWYQDGSTLAWTLIFDLPPTRVTAGDVTGQ